MNVMISDVLASTALEAEVAMNVSRALREAGNHTVSDLVLRHAANPCAIPNILRVHVDMDTSEAILAALCSVLVPVRTDLRASLQVPHVSTGCDVLDSLLCGGWRRGVVSEVSGEASAGKTTLAIQTALSVLRRRGTVLYFAVEAFPDARLHQMSGDVPPSLIDNLFICSERDGDAIVAKLETVRETIAIRSRTVHPVQLIIVDSIAAMLVGAAETNYALSALACKVGRLLHGLAQEHSVAVLVTNQIRSIDGITVPAIGLPWAYVVSTRVVIERDADRDSLRRKVRVAFSNHLKTNTTTVVVTQNGLRA